MDPNVSEAEELKKQLVNFEESMNQLTIKLIEVIQNPILSKVVTNFATQNWAQTKRNIQISIAMIEIQLENYEQTKEMSEEEKVAFFRKLAPEVSKSEE